MVVIRRFIEANLRSGRAGTVWEGHALLQYRRGDDARGGGRIRRCGGHGKLGGRDNGAVIHLARRQRIKWMKKMTPATSMGLSDLSRPIGRRRRWKEEPGEGVA